MDFVCVSSSATLRTLMCALAFVVGPVMSHGQGSPSGEDEPETVFTHRVETGLSLHTRGMGVHVERGTYRGVGKVRTWSFEIVSMKHPKEVRSFNPVYDQGKSYVFGKVNNAYIARLGWGNRTIATPKLRNGAVAIGSTRQHGAGRDSARRKARARISVCGGLALSLCGGLAFKEVHENRVGARGDGGIDGTDVDPAGECGRNHDIE